MKSAQPYPPPAASDSPPPRRRRGLIYGSFGIILFIVLFLGLSQLQRHFTQQKIDAKLAAIRAQGLPISLVELNTFYEAVPDEENAALLLNQVSRHIVNWPYYDTHIGISRTSLLYATNPITPQAKAALSNLISSNQPALKLIHKATDRSRFRYPLDFTQDPAASINHWGEMKKLVQLLRLESLNHFAEDRKVKALNSVRASLFVIRSMDGEPVQSSLHAQYACAAIALSGLEELLQRADFTAADLQSLQDDIHTLENSLDITRVLHGTRAYTLGSWPTLASSVAARSGYAIATPFGSFPAFVQRRAWQMYEQGGHKEADLLNFLDLYEEILAIAKLPSQEALVASQNLEKQLKASLKPSMNMIKTTSELSLLLQIFPKQAALLAVLRNAQTALAVERFRLENNRLPDGLGEIIPQYLSAAPIDPFTGHPLQYRFTEHGFRVYCFGEDGQDDGGLTRLEKSYSENDDLVFKLERQPSPATP